MPSLTTNQKVAIAVTVPLAAVVVYLLLKWSREDDEDVDDYGEESQGGFATSNEIVLEVSVPQSLVGAVIGRGGCNIKAIQKESQTRINLKDDVEESDGEDMADETKSKERTRIILIRGSRERAKNAEVLIRKVIAEQPVVEKTTMDIPQRVIGRIIGKGGKTIRQLCRISGARIKFDRDDEGDNRICEIIGTQNQIEYAKQLIYEKINEDNAFKKREKQTSDDKATKDNLSFVKLPTDGDYFGVYVSAMESPGRFWIQVVTKDSKQLDDLVEEMTVFYGDHGEGYPVNEPKVDDLCCTPFEHDRSWYRGKITKVTPPDVHVHYLDFGDRGTVPISNAKELRVEYCYLPFQAIECNLANIKPKDVEWDQKAFDLFEKLSCCAQWKVLMARVVDMNNNVAAIELFDTNGDQDVNIEKELVKQGCALYIDDIPSINNEDGSESPRTPSNSPQSSDDNREIPVVKEQLITPQATTEQYRSFQFSDESLENDFDSFEFESAVSPEVSTGSPVDEPAVSAVEQNVVSCADISQLPSLLDFVGTTEDFEGRTGGNMSSGGITSDEFPVAPEEKLVGSSSGTFTAPDTSSNNDNREIENIEQLMRESLPEVQLEADIDEHFTVTSEPRPNVSSEIVESPTQAEELLESEPVGDGHFTITSEPQPGTHSEMVGSPTNADTSEIPKSESLESGHDRSVSDDGTSTIVGTPKKDEVDSGATLFSPRLQKTNVLKGGKRLLAANFNQLPSSNSQEESEEDDDDSLYLSAREDTDSIEFASAKGSTLDLHSSDSESDVTPSGYLSDTDDELTGDGDEMRNKTKLDSTLLAEKLEPYADK